MNINLYTADGQAFLRIGPGFHERDYAKENPIYVFRTTNDPDWENRNDGNSIIVGWQGDKLMFGYDALPTDDLIIEVNGNKYFLPKDLLPKQHYPHADSKAGFVISDITNGVAESVSIQAFRLAKTENHFATYIESAWRNEFAQQQSQIQHVYSLNIAEAVGQQVLSQILARREALDRIASDETIAPKLVGLFGNCVQNNMAESFVRFGEFYEKAFDGGEGKLISKCQILMANSTKPLLKKVLEDAAQNKISSDMYGSGGIVEYNPLANNDAKANYVIIPQPNYAIITFFGATPDSIDGVAISVRADKAELASQEYYGSENRNIFAQDDLHLVRAITASKMLLKLNGKDVCGLCGECTDESGCAPVPGELVL